MDHRCVYAAKPFVPDLSSLLWIGLSSGASDKLWFHRLDIILVKSQLLPGSWRGFIACSYAREQNTCLLSRALSLQDRRGLGLFADGIGVSVDNLPVPLFPTVEVRDS